MTLSYHSPPFSLASSLPPFFAASPSSFAYHQPLAPFLSLSFSPPYLLLPSKRQIPPLSLSRTPLTRRCPHLASIRRVRFSLLFSTLSLSLALAQSVISFFNELQSPRPSFPTRTALTPPRSFYRFWLYAICIRVRRCTSLSHTCTPIDARVPYVCLHMQGWLDTGRNTCT